MSAGPMVVKMDAMTVATLVGEKVAMMAERKGEQRVANLVVHLGCRKVGRLETLTAAMKAVGTAGSTVDTMAVGSAAKLALSLVDSWAG